MTEESPNLGLSFAQANAVCREFISIGDKIFDYMARLEEAGFAAFLPRHSFIESFAGNAEQLEIHRRYILETAKIQLARPWPMRITEEDNQRLFRSTFIDRLRQESDEANGVSLGELGQQYPGGEAAWRSEIDPCKRRMIQAEVADRQGYQIVWDAMVDAERRAFQFEVQQHATGLGRIPHTFESKGRFKFFIALMERDAGPLGFEYDKLKSRQSYPVFTKPLTSSWDLCWALGNPRTFLNTPFQGDFTLFLELRHRDLRGPPVNALGRFLHIRYHAVVPGFFNAYWEFYDLDELELCIKAYLQLYGLMAPTIERGMSKALG